jgi:tetratricopeptide (TPR) repeat protein
LVIGCARLVGKMNGMRLLILSLSVFLLAGCVPPDDYHPKPTALAQSRALSIYEEGLGYTRKKQYDQAIKCFDESIKLDPEFPEAYLARGDALTEKREYKKAIADFDHLLKIAPDLANDRGSIYIYRDMAVCHTALEQWSAVLVDCDKMISFNGRYPFAYMARSIAYDRLGKPDLAKKDSATYEALKHPIGE